MERQGFGSNLISQNKSKGKWKRRFAIDYEEELMFRERVRERSDLIKKKKGGGMKLKLKQQETKKMTMKPKSVSSFCMTLISQFIPSHIYFSVCLSVWWLGRRAGEGKVD